MLITNIFAVCNINQTLLCDRHLSNSCELLSLTFDCVPLTIQQTVVESEVTPSIHWHRQCSSPKKPTEAGWLRYAPFSLSFTWPLQTSLYNHYFTNDSLWGAAQEGKSEQRKLVLHECGSGKHFVHMWLLFGYCQESTKNKIQTPHILHVRRRGWRTAILRVIALLFSHDQKWDNHTTDYKLYMKLQLLFSSASNFPTLWEMILWLANMA